jgi:hypothetical protein
MTTPTWFGYLRSILEVFYFLAGIVIAVFAGLGLKQISLTKKIATTSAKREAIRFAAERCEYYANTCVPASAELRAEHERLKLTFLNKRLQFSINTVKANNVESKSPVFTNFDRNFYATEFNKMVVVIVKHCNALEAFAIPFAARVADDELGYQETASAFCKMVEKIIGMIQILREGGARYESTLTLYERWKNRLIAEDLEGQVKQMQAMHRVATEKAKVPADQEF